MKWIIIGTLLVFGLCIIYYYFTQQTKKERKDLFSLEEYYKSYKKEIKYQPMEPLFRLHDYPQIFNIHQCYQLYSAARSHLEKDEIEITRNGQVFLKKRCNSTTFQHDSYSILHEIVTTLTGFPKSHHRIQLSRYSDGDFYDYHYDFNKNSDCVATLFLYLNDDFYGGETEFESLVIQPERGKLVFFWNEEHGKAIQESRYRQREVLTGNKWLVSIFVHQKEIPSYSKNT
jgi:hypothetical protein